MIKEILITEIKYHKLLLIIETVLLAMTAIIFSSVDLEGKTLSIKISLIVLYILSFGIYQSGFRKEKRMERFAALPITTKDIWSVRIYFGLINWSVILLIMIILLLIRGYFAGSYFEINSLLIINFVVVAQSALEKEIFIIKKGVFNNLKQLVIVMASMIIFALTVILYFGLLFGNDPVRIISGYLGLDPASGRMFRVSAAMNFAGLASLYLSYGMFRSRRSFIEPKSAY